MAGLRLTNLEMLDPKLSNLSKSSITGEMQFARGKEVTISRSTMSHQFKIGTLHPDMHITHLVIGDSEAL